MFEETPGLRLRSTIIFILGGGFGAIVSIPSCDSECTHNNVATTEYLEAIPFYPLLPEVDLHMALTELWHNPYTIIFISK